jgi:hypothetical protein
VPVSGSVDGEFAAVLTKEMLPRAAPVEGGVNVTLNCALCPAGITVGSCGPLIAYPELAVAEAEFRVTLPPDALTVTVCAALVLPTLVEGKVKLVGLSASWLLFTTAPVPESPTVEGELVPELAKMTESVSEPCAWGAKVTEN